MPESDSSFCPVRRRLLAGAVALALSGLRSVGAAPTAGARVPASEQESRLLAVCRTLFPHDFLSDDTYLVVVQKLQTRAAGEPAFAALVEAGLTALPADFAPRDQAAREAALAPMAGSPFFKAMRQTTAATLYQLPALWQSLGYPGPSVGFGGYADRPLVSLDWLRGVNA